MTTLLAREVLDLLKPAGKLTTEEIAEKVGATVTDTKSALQVLSRSGCVVPTGDGWDVVPVLRKDRE